MDVPAGAIVVTACSRIGVFTCARNGVFQPMIIGYSSVTFYRFTGRVLRRLDATGASRALYSVADLPEAVFLFANVCLEAVNHACVRAMTRAAANPANGVVSAHGSRPEHFFAVRRELLVSAGGLAVSSEERLSDVFQGLLQLAESQDLHNIIVDEALATPAA